MLCLEHNISEEALLYQILLHNEHGKASSRKKDQEKYITKLIYQAKSEYKQPALFISAHDLSKMEFSESHTVIELSGRQNFSERTVKFLKLRNGPPLPDIYVKRDCNLIYQVVDERSKCPARKVVEILKNDFGGDCNQKGLLIEKICQQVECSESTAKKGIDKAEAKGMIKRRKIGRSIRIQVKNK